MYYSYMKSLLEHKRYVIKAGRVLKVPLWRLLVHDWQKFTRWEFKQYARFYHGDELPADYIVLDYYYAWLHHENTAPHHWGYWIPRSGEYVNKPLPMPETYVREMVADWLGAGRAYTGKWDMSEWLNQNLMSMRMHVTTRNKVIMVLQEIGYEQYQNGYGGWYVGQEFTSRFN